MTPALKEDLDQILASGVNHTGRVMELLKMRGWKDNEILPPIYQALLQGRLDPNGKTMPFRAN